RREDNLPALFFFRVPVMFPQYWERVNLLLIFFEEREDHAESKAGEGVGRRVEEGDPSATGSASEAHRRTGCAQLPDRRVGDFGRRKARRQASQEAGQETRTQDQAS